ncbi:MAG: hypothetical protein AAF721_28245 [Myxococcota bacterium]
MGDEPAGKVGPWLEIQGATFPTLMDQRTRAEWNDPPGGNHSLEIVVDRGGIVRSIGNGVSSETLAPLIDELLMQ